MPMDYPRLMHQHGSDSWFEKVIILVFIHHFPWETLSASQKATAVCGNS